jgi:hypothetical protein
MYIFGTFLHLRRLCDISCMGPPVSVRGMADVQTIPAATTTKRELTMVKTRRSLQSNKPSPLDSSEDRNRQRVLGVLAEGIQGRGNRGEECYTVLKSLFAQSTPGIWFRILPVDDQDDDVCVGLGVEWRYLLPLLTTCGLLRSTVTSVVKEVHVVRSQWDEMAKAMDHRMEVSSIRTVRYVRRCYFFCVGKPRYRNPLVQDNQLQVHGMSMISRTREVPREL